MMLRLFKGLLLALPLMLASGCKEADELSGGTTGVALYAYDGSSSSVFVWTDVNALYDGAATTVAPTKQISSPVFGSKISSLAWGGLCLDSRGGHLYLVSETGNIVRVSNIRSQSGPAVTSDVVSFSLSNTGRLSNATFGQASVDAQNDRLYITENGSSGTQIWVVNNASSQGQGVSIALQALAVNGDTGGTGVAAGGGSVYAFMLDGDTVGSLVTYSGPRLRKGTAAGFAEANTLIGGSTLLGRHGSLALDTGSGYLFVARHNTDAGATTAPILVFPTGVFGQAYDQAPSATLGSATEQGDLRVLAHAGTKDWLAGLRGNGETSYGVLCLWKSPLSGSAAKVITATPATAIFKGAALDGNAS